MNVSQSQQVEIGVNVKFRRRYAVLLCLGFAIACLLRFPASALAQSAAVAVPAESHAAELRGVWLTNIDSDVLFSEEKLEHAIDRLHSLNFNTIYPTVWNGGYTLYPSDVMEQASGVRVDPHPGLEDRDMLAEAVEMGHAKGLSVIPWFEFGLMAPAESELVQRHPEWVTTRQDGTAVFPLGELSLVWLNPAHPGVQRFLIDLVAESVENYDIDGIQFDDHFGINEEFGYDPYTVSLYQQEHNGQLPPQDFTDPDWVKWRSGHVTELLVRIFSAVKTRKPDCLISLSPNPKEFSYEKYLQNWWTWQKLGFLDELIVQVYRSDMERFIGELDRPELQIAREWLPVSIGILTGLRVLPVEIEQVQQQVQVTRDRRFAGVSFFFYETLGDQDGVYQTLFPTPAQRPDVNQYDV